MISCGTAKKFYRLKIQNINVMMSEMIMLVVMGK